MARSKAVLGDQRRDERAAWMLDRIVASGSLKPREFGGGRGGEVAAHRFLSSDDVDPVTVLTPHVQRTSSACQGRRVVAARLGGWNCYYKPPGPKTMARGLERLIDRIAGFKAGNERRNV